MLTIPHYEVHTAGVAKPLLTTNSRSEAYHLASYETELTGQATFVTETVQ